MGYKISGEACRSYPLLAPGDTFLQAEQSKAPPRMFRLAAPHPKNRPVPSSNLQTHNTQSDNKNNTHTIKESLIIDFKVLSEELREEKNREK